MSFITVAGETQIAVKQGVGQPLNVTSFVLANITGQGAEPVDRIESMPAGGDIVADLPVTKSGYVNGNQVVYSLTMDSSLGDFDFNWIGLKDDEGVLIAVAYIPTISKTATAGPVPGNNITRNFLIAFSGITATTAIAVPAATWQIDFNARLWGIDGRERLSNLDIYGPAAFFGSGWEVVRQGATTTYDVLNGLGYVGGVRIDNAATQIIAIAGPPKAVWLDVSLEGDISSVNAVIAIIADANAHSDYTDGNGFDHYLTKIADIAANGDVTDLRYEADHEARPDPHSQYLTPAEGDAAYDALGGLAAHAAASDPHGQYLKEADAVSQAAAEAGISTTVRAWTALRVKQAIQALAIPAGSKMLFAQAAAPTGWTLITTDSANNRMLRVVNSAGGGVGGSASPIASHVHTTAGHALSIAETPAHSHQIRNSSALGSVETTLLYGDRGGAADQTASRTMDAGGNAAHSHGNTGAAFTPRYLNLILCSKN